MIVIDAEPRGRLAARARGATAARRSPPTRSTSAATSAGSIAVLVGLLLVRAGYARPTRSRRSFVAVLVVAAAGRLMRQNVDVLMDRSPAAPRRPRARRSRRSRPPVELRRLRLRQAGGRHFADVVIGVAPDAAVGAGARGRRTRSRRQSGGAAGQRRRRPRRAARRRRTAFASGAGAALRVPRVREIHNVTVLRVGDRTEVSLHLKLPGDLSLGEAHASRRGSSGDPQAVPRSTPCRRTSSRSASPRGRGAGPRDVEDEARGRTPDRPRDDRAPNHASCASSRPTTGLVAYLTRARRGWHVPRGGARTRERGEGDPRPRPEIVDVLVHTEPGSARAGTPPRHLHDREQRVEPLERLALHRHAEHRQQGVRRHHARQVGGAAGRRR